MNELGAALLSWLLDYTYPVAALTVMVGSLGVPLPSTLIVLAAGAMAVDGDVDLATLFALIFGAAVLGDTVLFVLARWGGHAAVARAGPKVGLTTDRVQAVERRFERWGGLLVVVTRCILTGLALPTTVVAAASGYPLRYFLFWAVFGEAIWTGQFLALGWFYGANWVSLLDYLDDASMALTGLGGAAVLAFVLWRLLRANGGKPTAEEEPDG